MTGATTLSSTLNVSGTTSLATASTNDIVVTGAATGVAPSIAVAGTDANINLQLSGKGTGGIILGAGQAITAHYHVSSAQNLNIAATTCVTFNVTVTGAAVGDTVIATPAYVAGGTASFVTQAGHLDWDASITAANTATVRVCDNTGSATNPAAETWWVDVWHH